MEIADLVVDELSASSPEFKIMWDDNEITGKRDGIKRLHHPFLGVIELEFSNFTVEGRFGRICQPSRATGSIDCTEGNISEGAGYTFFKRQAGRSIPVAAVVALA